MSRREEEFLKRLQATFKIEAEERLGAIADGLTQLEQPDQQTNQAEIVEMIFREVHSLKGAARSVNLRDIEKICQLLESIFALLKRRKIALEMRLFDQMHQSLDLIDRLIKDSASVSRDELTQLTTALVELETNRVMPTGTLPPLSRSLEAAVESIQSPITSTPAPEQSKSAPTTIQPVPSPPATNIETAPVIDSAPVSTPTASISETDVSEQLVITDEPAREREPITISMSPIKLAEVTAKSNFSNLQHELARSFAGVETIRISINKLDRIFYQAEELLYTKQAAQQHYQELRELREQVRDWQKAQSVLATQIANIDEPMVGAMQLLEMDRAQFRQLSDRLVDLIGEADQYRRVLGVMVDNLLAQMKQVLMMPFASLTDGLPRLVRDIARECGKEIDFSAQGSTVEIDRRILENLKDPLIHLLRNAIDHGIETPAVRAQMKKPPRGKIVLSISQLDNQVLIQLSDDGGGIDSSKVRRAAIEMEIITATEADALSENEICALIFQSAVTTSPSVTEISGRGLGLAIVREQVIRLGGEIGLDSQLGRGTTFQLLLPLTLATFRGILVRVFEQLFIVPVYGVERVLRVAISEIRVVEEREYIMVEQQQVPLASLAQLLALPRRLPVSEQRFLIALLLKHGNERLAIVVDEAIQEQEVLVKSLGRQLARVRNVAAATVLANGRVVPILNIADLIKTAQHHSSQLREPREQTNNRTILIVEDSITSRMLLQNILLTAGYNVKTAADGQEAWLLLQSDTIDLVVSDVEMPRLNGFELTARIRADARLIRLPVILVTSLDKREDRERGVDVGANAYIVKGDFEQSQLLSVIARLI